MPEKLNRRGIAPGGVTNARRLRRETTPAEEFLWAALRDRQLDGLKFRRQHPVGPYVLDFCCPVIRFSVEVDGAGHAEQVEQDQYRTERLLADGYTELRFSNDDILTNLDAVLSRIQSVATSLSAKSLGDPKPTRGTTPKDDQ